MKFPHILFAASLALGALCACDSVDESERFSGPITVEAKKNVLVEDFTGQRCVNCPSAAEVVASMQAAYGTSRVVAVAIHGGSLGVSESSSAIGLATEQGNEYNTHWGVESWPSGLIDRTGGLQDYEKWQASVLARFSTAPKADISIDRATYDPATSQLTLNVTLTSEEGADGRVQVWLTENGLVRTQLTQSGYDTTYEHNHVFRASVSDPYGDPLTLAAGQSEQLSYTYTLKTEASDKAPGWQPANMSAVVFYYNDADGVMQVVDAALTAE